MDSIFEAAFLVAAANGELSEEEMSHHFSTIEQVLGSAVSPEEADNLISTYSERLQAEGPDARLASIGSQLRGTEAAGAAYVLAAGLAYQNEVDEAEDTTLAALAHALGLSEEDIVHLDEQVRSSLGCAEV